jgi:septal ring factor EnvC (AmiA/AmiB activator)
MYANTSRQLTEAEDQVQQLQAQTEEKDKQFKDLEARSRYSENQLGKTQKEKKQLQDDLKAVGKCINIASGLAVAENDAQTGVVIGAMNEPCSKAVVILERLEAEVGQDQ